MKSTSGSLALENAIPSKNAGLVDRVSFRVPQLMLAAKNSKAGCRWHDNLGQSKSKRELSLLCAAYAMSASTDSMILGTFKFPVHF